MRSLPTLFLIIFLTGCAAGNPVPLNEEVYYYDTFARASSGWDVARGEEGQTGYKSGAYLIRVEQPNLDLWGTPGLDLEDASIEVDAKRAEGAAESTYGVICRYVDADNYYFGIIYSDGYYAIGKRVEGGSRLLSGTTLQPAPHVRGGGALNHLRFDCVSSTLTLYANGTLLGEVDDETFTRGDAGLIAGSLSEAGAAVSFDEFVVFNPIVK